MTRLRKPISSIQSRRNSRARSSEGVNQVQAAIASSKSKKRWLNGRQMWNRYLRLAPRLNGRSKYGACFTGNSGVKCQVRRFARFGSAAVAAIDSCVIGSHSQSGIE